MCVQRLFHGEPHWGSQIFDRSDPQRSGKDSFHAKINRMRSISPKSGVYVRAWVYSLISFIYASSALLLSVSSISFRRPNRLPLLNSSYLQCANIAKMYNVVNALYKDVTASLMLCLRVCLSAFVGRLSGPWAVLRVTRKC